MRDVTTTISLYMPQLLPCNDWLIVLIPVRVKENKLEVNFKELYVFFWAAVILTKLAYEAVLWATAQVPEGKAHRAQPATLAIEKRVKQEVAKTMPSLPRSCQRGSGRLTLMIRHLHSQRGKSQWCFPTSTLFRDNPSKHCGGHCREPQGWRAEYLNKKPPVVIA